MLSLPHPPADAQQKLTWFASRFERWTAEGERIGLRPVHLEDLSGAMGNAAVGFMESEENPSPAAEARFSKAIEGLDEAGVAVLDAIRTHADADPAPADVLGRAMLVD